MVSRLRSILQQFDIGWMTWSVAGLAVLFFLLLLWQVQARKRQEKRLDVSTRLLQHIKPSAGLENNLNFILDMYSHLVDAYGYAFYVLDEAQQKFVLKAVRHRQDKKGQTADGSKGLAPSQKEVYQPPLSLPFAAGGREIELVKEGEVPLLTIPVQGGKSVIRIGPLATLPKKVREKLAYVTNLLPQMVDVLVETDRMKMQTDVVVTSEHALRAVSSMALDTDAIMRKTVGMFASALGLTDGFAMFQQAGAFQVPVLFGWSGGHKQYILRDREFGAQLWRAVDAREVAFVRRGDGAYPKVESLLQDHQAESLLIAKFVENGRTGLLVYRIVDSGESTLSEAQLTSSIRTLSKQLTKLLRVQNGIRPLTQSYVEMLKLLSRTIDNLNPYTVGYSEMMSRYSIIIAQEMGLPHREIQDIAQAAYLSNIGVLGLSEELYLKEGKFSDIEFEKMKLHADVGAEIVEMLIGNKAMASYIRHHHERMDGHGYPAGLRGQEIPTGARIIAVVQTFLAKINGRKYRAPLSFDKALDLLKSSAGAQLDPQVVDALHRWFQRKRLDVRGVNQALGNCWDMCCSPSEVCASCPAFQQQNQNCWEQPHNNCQMHGKSCETCFVYTEAMARGGVKAIV
jgi:HD-GYP domain-containing protein (c-di-GMP phosphodiesterase class II)